MFEILEHLPYTVFYEYIFFAETSGSVVRLEIKGMVFQDSPLAETLCCVLEQDTSFIHCLILVHSRKTRNCPGMTETLLTGK